MAQAQLDAVVMPCAYNSVLHQASVEGLPAVSVPMGKLAASTETTVRRDGLVTRAADMP